MLEIHKRREKSGRDAEINTALREPFKAFLLQRWAEKRVYPCSWSKYILRILQRK